MKMPFTIISIGPIATVSFVAGIVAFGAAAKSPPLHQTGISGYSGNPSSGGATCIACHSGGQPPRTKLEGPSLVATGNTVTYTLRISGGQSIAGGLDVSVTAGGLVATDPGTQLLNSEITHVQPRYVDANGDVLFTFDWNAPASAATATFYAAGNSVDRDYTSSGDLSDKAKLVVTVQDCDVTFTPYGSGLAGSGGFVPALWGVNGPASGNYTIKIDGGLGGAAGLLVVGRAAAQLPFAGGTLWIDLTQGFVLAPVQLGGAAGVAGAGTLDLNGIDVRDWIGTTLDLQGIFVDPGAVRGLSLTNGLEMDVS
jgi:hypothetical protein